MTALGDLGADPAGVEVAAQLARATLLVGDPRSGLDWAERTIAAADRLGLDAVRTDVLVTRGTARFRLGAEAAGLDDLRQAIGESETAGYRPPSCARGTTSPGVVADDPRLALETAREGFELATSMGVGEIAGQLAEVACSVALDTGDWGWAMSTIGTIVDGPIPSANRINLLAIGATIGALQGDAEAVRAFEAIHPLPADTDIQVRPARHMPAPGWRSRPVTSARPSGWRHRRRAGASVPSRPNSSPSRLGPGCGAAT